METENNLEKFLRAKMSSGQVEIDTPLLSLVDAARKKILLRKKPSPAPDDLFTLIASFLNLKVKLIHAVIATLLIGGGLVYFTKEKEDPAATHESHDTQYVSNIAAVRNSTVLSSINTFILIK